MNDQLQNKAQQSCAAGSDNCDPDKAAAASGQQALQNIWDAQGSAKQDAQTGDVNDANQSLQTATNNLNSLQTLNGAVPAVPPAQTAQAGPAPGTEAPINGDSSSNPNGNNNGNGKNGKNGTGSGDNSDFQVDADCKNSANFNGKYSCKGTRTFITTTQVVVVGGQMAGSTTLNTMGQQAQQNMVVNGATQSQMYQLSINMQESAAKAQIALGATQLAMGYLEHRASKEHSNNFNDSAKIKYTANNVGVTAGQAPQTDITASGNQTEANAGFTHLYQNQALGQATSSVNAGQATSEANRANAYRSTAMNEQASVAKDAGPVL